MKLHQAHSEDALKFTSIEIHHVNVYVYEHVNQLLKWLQLRQRDNVKASHDNRKTKNAFWKITF